MIRKIKFPKNQPEHQRKNPVMEAVPYLILLIFWIIFFRDLIFGGQVFYCCDNLLINLPSKMFLADALKSGVFPLWNPEIFSGMPFLADINLGILYPANLLYLVLNPVTVLSLNIILHILFMSAGFYLAGRSLGISKISAIISAIIFSYSGTVMVYTDNTPMLQVAAWLPWTFYFLVSYLQKIEVNRYLPVVACLVIQLFAGHPQLTYYSWLFLIAYLLVFAKGSLLSKLFRILKIFIPVLLIGSVQLIPFLELAGMSTRTNLGWDYATFGSFQPLMIFRLLIPAVSGNLKDGTNWLLGASVYGYVGILPILMLISRFPKEKRFWFYLAAGIISLLLSFGKFSPIYFLAYYLVPFVGQFRVPTHFLIIYTFSFTVLAGMCLDRLSAGNKISRRKILFLLAITGGLVLVSVSFWKLSNLGGIVQPVLLHLPLIGIKLARIGDSGLQLLLSNVSRDALILALISAGFIFVRSGNFPRGYKLILIGILCGIDLLFHNLPAINTVPLRRFDKWVSSLAGFTHSIPGFNTSTERILVDTSSVTSQVKSTNTDPYLSETDRQISVSRSNLGMIAGFKTPDGYSSLVYKPYHDYWRQSVSDPTGVVINKNDPTLNFSGVKYIIGGGSDTAFKTGRYMPVHKGDLTAVYQLTDPVPRIFLLEDTRIISGGYKVIHDNPNEVVIQTDYPDPVHLVLLDTNYPGWQADIDGVRTDIIPYKKVYRSLNLASGLHTVRFVYNPQSLMLGILVTSASLVYLFIYRKRLSN